jgi:predicted transcriptional regulator
MEREICSDKYEEIRVESLEKYFEQIEYYNNQIEEFLQKIDSIHGTKYCPTRKARLRI